MSIAVQLKKAEIGYDYFSVLKNLSLKIEHGDFCLIVGPNGSGKSTLMKSMIGVNPLRKGKVYLDGELIQNYRHWDHIGYLPQRNSNIHPLFPATVLDIVKMGANGKEDRIEKAMDIFELNTIRNRMIGELSGGQYQRTLLARTLASPRKMVFLDEPNAALEPRIRERFHKELERLHEQEHLTIVYVTHDIGEVHHCATHLIYVDREILFDGSLKDFCLSDNISSHFGSHTQHTVCHQHKHKNL